MFSVMASQCYRNLYRLVLFLTFLLFLGCGQEQQVQSNFETTPQKTTIMVAITGSGPTALNQKGTTQIPDTVLSVALDVFDQLNPQTLIKTVTKNITEGQNTLLIQMELSPDQTYNLRARAYSAIDLSGSLLYAGSLSGLILLSGGTTSVTIPLSSVGLPSPEAQNASVVPNHFSAQLSANVNPGGHYTLAYFEWGTDLFYGNRTPVQIMGAGTDFVRLEQTIEDLTPGWPYHSRVVVENSGNTNALTDQTFTTQPATATLSWTAPEVNTDNSPLVDLAGFFVHYGTVPGEYSEKIFTTNTSTLVTVPAAGTYFFNVSAYDHAANESTLTMEVSKTFF